MELLYLILRTDFAVNETCIHQTRPSLACPISALGELRDKIVSRDQDVV